MADITYIPTWAGFLYLAVAVDAFTRRVVGWRMSDSLHTEVVLEALEMALHNRRPKDVIHHSDRGPRPAITFDDAAARAGSNSAATELRSAADLLPNLALVQVVVADAPLTLPATVSLPAASQDRQRITPRRR